MKDTIVEILIYGSSNTASSLQYVSLVFVRSFFNDTDSSFLSAEHVSDLNFSTLFLLFFFITNIKEKNIVKMIITKSSWEPWKDKKTGSSYNSSWSELSSFQNYLLGQNYLHGKDEDYNYALKLFYRRQIKRTSNSSDLQMSR